MVIDKKTYFYKAPESEKKDTSVNSLQNKISQAVPSPYEKKITDREKEERLLLNNPRSQNPVPPSQPRNIPSSTSSQALDMQALLQRLEKSAEKNKTLLNHSTTSPTKPSTPVLNYTKKTLQEEGKTSLNQPKTTSPIFSALSTGEKQKPELLTTRTAGTSSLFSQRNEVIMTDEEFFLLRDFLYEESGIFLPEARKYLITNRLTPRLKELGLRTFGKYYNYLRFDANKDSERNNFFESMTTNETSFFRNNPQLDIFRDKILPKVLEGKKAKKQNTLNIWSAGCSSGEEPYTLSIMLHEYLKNDINKWKIRITANDISLAMLGIAKTASYSQYALRTTPPEIIDQYFTKDGQFYFLKQKVKDLVSFGQINLSDKRQLNRLDKSDIVFCRNVIIYFDDEMKKNVISSFYDNLLPGGYLFIGHSESLHSISRAFKPEVYSGSIVYLKQS